MLLLRAARLRVLDPGRPHHRHEVSLRGAQAAEAAPAGLDMLGAAHTMHVLGARLCGCVAGAHVRVGENVRALAGHGGAAFRSASRWW